MKKAAAILILIIFAQIGHAFFVAKGLQEKAASADLIIHGSVVSVTWLSPEKDDTDDSKISYSGPHCIAVVKVAAVWKRPDRTHFRDPDQPSLWADPKFVMVPCRYSYDPSPSELTKGNSYVLFLKTQGSNIFDTVDPASTHLVHEDRVANFGMNHPPSEEWEKKSKPFEEFREAVANALKASADRKPSDKKGHASAISNE